MRNLLSDICNILIHHICPGELRDEHKMGVQPGQYRKQGCGVQPLFAYKHNRPCVY